MPRHNSTTHHQATSQQDPLSAREVHAVWAWSHTLTCLTSTPRARTLVVMSTFVKLSRNSFMTLSRSCGCHTVHNGIVGTTTSIFHIARATCIPYCAPSHPIPTHSISYRHVFSVQQRYFIAGLAHTVAKIFSRGDGLGRRMAENEKRASDRTATATTDLHEYNGRADVGHAVNALQESELLIARH